MSLQVSCGLQPQATSQLILGNSHTALLKTIRLRHEGYGGTTELSKADPTAMRLCGRGRRISYCVGVNLSLLLRWRHMWTADNSTNWSMAVSAATCGSFQHGDRVCLNILPQSLCKSRHKLVIKVQRHQKSRKDSRFSGVCAYTAYIILFAWFLPPISIPELRRIDRRHCIVVKWHFIHVICWQSQIHKYLISTRCTCMCIQFELKKKKVGKHKKTLGII